jgi:hypothetical protein
VRGGSLKAKGGQRVGVEFRVGGRKVSQRGFARGIANEALKGVDEEMQRRLSSIHCPTHGQRARVQSTRAGGDLTWHVEGCCEALVAQIKKHLS